MPTTALPVRRESLALLRRPVRRESPVLRRLLESLALLRRPVRQESQLLQGFPKNLLPKISSLEPPLLCAREA